MPLVTAARATGRSQGPRPGRRGQRRGSQVSLITAGPSPMTAASGGVHGTSQPGRDPPPHGAGWPQSPGHGIALPPSGLGGSCDLDVHLSFLIYETGTCVKGR